MTTALDTIIAYKKAEVDRLKGLWTVSGLLDAAKEMPPPRGFAAAMDAVVARGENALICELKRKSPSAGEILPGADPLEIALDYEAGGAACLSVLTDGPSFGGSLEDFATIRKAVKLPLLRKDFMVDPIQVAESRAHGADCVLVIMAAVDDAIAADLTATALTLGMDVLVETHNEDELTRALTLPSPLVGVNNRDLKRMVTDLSTTERLAPAVPAGRVLISESGLSEPAHLIRLRAFGVRRFLIGEALMRRGMMRRQTVHELRMAGKV